MLFCYLHPRQVITTVKPVEPPESADYWNVNGVAGVATDNSFEAKGARILKVCYRWQHQVIKNIFAFDDMITNTEPVCSIKKQCTKCKQIKPLNEFYSFSKSKDGYRSSCIDCWAVYASKYRKTRQGKKIIHEASVRFWESDKAKACRERYRQSEAYAINRVSKYGITVAEYDIIFESQKGNCAICGLPEITRRLSIDHNHKTGEVRALLCNRCNFLVGIVEGKMELLRKAVDYVNKHGVNKVQDSICD